MVTVYNNEMKKVNIFDDSVRKRSNKDTNVKK